MQPRVRNKASSGVISNTSVNNNLNDGSRADPRIRAQPRSLLVRWWQQPVVGRCTLDNDALDVLSGGLLVQHQLLFLDLQSSPCYALWADFKVEALPVLAL